MVEVRPIDDIPTYSVIIPARNAAPFIGDAVDSARSQMIRPLEIIVVDDGSTDGSGAIVRALAGCTDTIRVVSQAHAGVAVARNRGIELARGEWLAFLDADDVWHPAKASMQFATLRARPDLVAIGGRMQFFGARRHLPGATGTRRLDSTVIEEIRAGRSVPFPISSVMVRRDVALRIGGFESSSSPAEDLEFLHRVANIGLIDTVEDVVGRYRLHPSSVSAQTFYDQRRRARFIARQAAVRARGQDLEYGAFAAAEVRTWNERRRERSDFHARCATVDVANGRDAMALAHAILSVLLTPARRISHVASKLLVAGPSTTGRRRRFSTTKRELPIK